MFSRTERLLLRPGWTEDAPALQAAIADPAILRNLMHAPSPYGLDDARDYLSREWDPRQPQFLIFSRTRGAPRLVGGCGIHADGDGRMALGYWIARPFWGLGFATEAAGAVMRIARGVGLKNIYASHFIDNPASGGVLRKIGFRPTGKVARRFSHGRQSAATALLFRDSGGAGQASSPDPAFDLYRDASPVAA